MSFDQAQGLPSKAASNDGRPWAWSKDIYSCWWPTPSLRMTTTANMWRSSISFRPEKPDERKDDVMTKKYADTVRKSDERRVGKGCVSTCRSRWAAENKKK